ncbi:MAG: acyltransferase [Alphaproteobacteria bacterium]|nr:acyltransferase [Alphaproteobacteria bacterium]
MRTGFPRLKSESDRFLRLDSLRFLAAVMVVVYHFRNQWTFASGPGWKMTQFGNMTFAVDLFFIISGIVITFVYEDRLDYRAFLKRRFARLAPLHYATFLFYFLAGFLALRAGYDFWEIRKYQPECALPQLLFLNAHGLCNSHSFNHVSWSIGAEMTVYLLFPLLLRMMGVHRALPGLVALACIAVLGMAEPWLPGDLPWHKLSYDLGVVRAIPGFLFGMSLWAYRHELGRLPFADAVLVALMLLFAGGVLAQAGRGAMVALTYAIAAVALAADQGGKSRSLLTLVAPLGTLTYGIYMLHPLVRTVGFPVLTSAGYSGNAAITICGLLVLPLAYISYFWFENPARRWLSRVRLRPIAVAA